jgi:ATP-dependent exoDNAse (exonuclease V) alpha subunit
MGTGKTTVVRAVVDAIRRVRGEGSSVLALAPIGKAADRLRELLAGKTGVYAETVHAFLARNGWLWDNLTLRRDGGKRETSRGAVRSYFWEHVGMLDRADYKANQLPPAERVV